MRMSYASRVQPQRYWDDAVAKVQREGRCRVCGSRSGVEFAHTVGRKYDARVELDDGSVVIYVDPDDGVPLCREHHFAYDRHELSVLEYLSLEEQAAAVLHVGVVRALRRLACVTA